MYHKKTQNTIVMILWRRTIQLLKKDEIIYIVANGNYSTFILTDETEIPCELSLKNLEKSLENSTFIRIHKSTIINLHHVNFFDFTEKLSANLLNKKYYPFLERSP